MLDKLRRVKKQSIVVIVSPLVALMKDQVASCSSKGLIAGSVSNEPGNEQMNHEVLEGRYQLEFLSPEVLFTRGRCREMLKEEPYYRRTRNFRGQQIFPVFAVVVELRN